MTDAGQQLNLRRYEAFIFDLDGTLIDSEKYHVRAFAQAMEELSGYRLTDAERREFSGNTTFDLSRELARRHGLSAEPRTVVRRKFELLYQVFRTEPFPGAQEFITRWHGRTKLALASNSPLHFVQRVLDDLRWADRFDVVITIDDVSRRKPDPEMLNLALARLNVTAPSALVFEDSIPGVGAALAAQCDVLLLQNPGHTLPSGVPGTPPTITWPELCQLPLP